MVGLNKLDGLYREIILDHYRNPRNQKHIEDADIKAEGNNPFCGDEVALQLKLGDGRVEEVGYQGRGCSICRASGSILSEVVIGRSVEEIERLTSMFKAMMRGKELSEEECEELGDLQAFSDVQMYPVRIKCALLAWVALEEGIEAHRSERQLP